LEGFIFRAMQLGGRKPAEPSQEVLHRTMIPPGIRFRGWPDRSSGSGVPARPV